MHPAVCPPLNHLRPEMSLEALATGHGRTQEPLSGILKPCLQFLAYFCHHLGQARLLATGLIAPSVVGIAWHALRPRYCANGQLRPPECPGESGQGLGPWMFWCSKQTGKGHVPRLFQQPKPLGREGLSTCLGTLFTVISAEARLAFGAEWLPTGC